MRKINLKEAIEQDKLADFMEQNKDLTGDKEKFNKTIDKMSNSSKSTHQTLTGEPSEN